MRHSCSRHYHQRVLRLLIKSVLLTLLSWQLLSCSTDSPEDQIRQNLAEIVAAVEARDRRGVNEFLSKDFVARTRGQSVDTNRLMFAYFRQVKNIRVVTYGIETDIADRQARVSLNAVVAGGEGWLPERLNVYQINTEWMKDDDWLVKSAEWERVVIEEHDLPQQIRQFLGAEEK